MPHLDLQHVHAGMVLGQDIFGAAGQFLLHAGTALNDRHLRMLRAHRIRQVAIDLTAHSATQFETHIEDRFRNCNAGLPLIQELQRLCRARLTQQQEGSA